MIAAVILSLSLTGPGEINYDKALDALAQVETGTRWDGHRIIGTYHRTASFSAFQITAGVLRQIGGDPTRAGSDNLYAARQAKRWLAYLLGVSGSLRSAFAAYRLGLGHRDWPEAQAYAARAMNLYLNNQGNK